MRYRDEEYIMISALQHYQYCPRQFALIHMEQYWAENFMTKQGKVLHERVDLPGTHRSAKRRVEYALPLASHELGISGVADAVEFRNSDGAVSVIPVEYKRGKEKADDCDRIQLCAQVLCLEEMMRIEIQSADLFYFETRSRSEVAMDEELRQKCRMVIAGCRALFASGITPVEIFSGKCRGCSLHEYCMPPRAKVSVQADFEESLK